MNTFKDTNFVILVMPVNGKVRRFAEVAASEADRMGFRTENGTILLREVGGPGDGGMCFAKVLPEVKTGRAMAGVGGRGFEVVRFECTTEADADGVIFSRPGERLPRTVCREDAVA